MDFSAKQKPKLTILTALYSFDDKLIKTFNSLKQALLDKKIRWVIKSCNPCSENDLLNFAGFEADIFFIAEKDSSLYEGLNSGLKYVDTDFFLVLGSGDCLLAGAEDFINNKILSYPTADGFMFSVNYEDYIYPASLDSIHFRMPCSHQGTILNTEKVLLLKGFDTRYKYAADYDLISRYFVKNPNILTFSNVISNNEPGGISERNKFSTVLELYSIAYELWSSKYKNFEFNDMVIQNLSNTNERCKNKKIKKENGENMQTPSELRQEIFSYLLNIENERKKEEKTQYENLYKLVNQLYKALEFANKDFLHLKAEIDSLKGQALNVNQEHLNFQALDSEEYKNQKSEDFLVGNEKFQKLFGSKKT